MELVRFYSDPAVASQVNLSGNLTSSIYVDRDNGAGVNVTGTVYDYNSSTGVKTSLGSTTSGTSCSLNVIVRLHCCETS